MAEEQKSSDKSASGEISDSQKKIKALFINGKFPYADDITEEDLLDDPAADENKGDLVDLGDPLMGKIRLTEDVDEPDPASAKNSAPLGRVESIDDLPDPSFDFEIKEEAPKFPALDVPAPRAPIVKEPANRNPLQSSAPKEPTNRNPLQSSAPKEPTNRNPLQTPAAKEPANRNPLQAPATKEPSQKNPLLHSQPQANRPEPTFPPDEEPEEFEPVDVQELPDRITPRHVEQWVEQGKIEVLLRAYPLIEHFSVRNRAITLLGEHAAKHYIDPLIILASVESDGVAQRQIMKLFTQLDKEKVSPNLNVLGMKNDQLKNVLIALGQLRINKLLPQIRQCTGHQDPMIRALAISALSQYGDTNPEMIALFAEKLRNDSSLKVRLAAAQSLAFLGTIECRTAFENAIEGIDVDEKIIEVLHTMRQKASFKDTRKQVETFDKKSLAESGGIFGEIEMGQVIKLGVVFVIFIGAMFYFWKQYRKYYPDLSQYNYTIDPNQPQFVEPERPQAEPGKFVDDPG